MVIDKLSDMKI